MKRTCTLESLVRDSDRKAATQDEEMGSALRDAVVATRAKIEEAFDRRVKFAARLKG